MAGIAIVLGIDKAEISEGGRVTVDVSEPPRIVVQSHGSCPDTGHVEELLRDALFRSRAPGHAWAVTMRVQSTGGHTLQANGEITDGNGIEVASRELSAPGGSAAVGPADCQGLARAVGVWASLVLDEEVVRAHGRAKMAPASPADEGAAGETASTGTMAWPPPAPPPELIPERDLFLQHDDARTAEVGVGWFLMTNTGVGAVMGATPFFVLETGHGLFLRPSVAIGSNASAAQPSALWMTGRVDACGRLPGLYSQDRGLQLDLCLGSDVGVIDAAETTPYVGVGPSLDLRGELASHLAAVVRGVWGLNLTSGTTGVASQAVVQPLWSGRLELAFSWKVR